MEKRFSNEIVRKVACGVAIIAGSSALIGCSVGSPNEPTVEDLRDDAEYFEMQRPDGTTMVCWKYAAQGEGDYLENTWFAVSCDWDGDYQGGSETPITTPPVDTLG